MSTITKRPSYPMIHLQAAVNKVQTLWLEVGANSMSRDVLAKTIGYSSLNGTAIMALSALHQYGLIQNTHGSAWGASPIAAAIFEAESKDERLNAIRQAFLKPEIFKEIYTKFGNIAGDVRKSIDSSKYLKSRGFKSEATITKVQVNYLKSTKYANLADRPNSSNRARRLPIAPFDVERFASRTDPIGGVDFKDWQRLQVGGSNFVFRILTLGGQNPNIEELEDLLNILELKLKRMKEKQS